MEDAASGSRLFSRNLILIGGLLLYACAFATLLRNKSFDVVAAVVVLVVFVAFPFAIFRFGFGYRIRDFGIQREGLCALGRSHLPVVFAVGGALLAFQYFVSSGGAAFRNGHFTTSQLLLGLPLCFIWL